LQHVPATRRTFFDDFIGGEIVVTTLSSGSSLVRGELLSLDIQDGWISARLTCREYAIGDPAKDAELVWYQSSNQPTVVLLRATPKMTDQGDLAFPEATPQGTTAVVSLPKHTQSSKVA